MRFDDGPSRTAIQSDASITRGNSGGPPVDAASIIGINTQIATLNRCSGNIGIGFAIPIERASDVAPRLISSS